MRMIIILVHILDQDGAVWSFSPPVVNKLGVPAISEGGGTLLLKVHTLVASARGMESLRGRRMMMR